MKYINIGCGYHYSTEKEWTNLDFISTGEGVIAHNLLAGIPFPDASFDLVYHSHILEHFTRQDGEKLIAECFRVLKPGGTLRIAIPDLERIAKHYLQFLEQGLNDPADEFNRANYEWIMLEMYDQTVRNVSGGNMAGYLFRDTIPNQDFVFERIGEEGRAIRTQYLNSLKNHEVISVKPTEAGQVKRGIVSGLKYKLKNYLLARWKIKQPENEIGKFRLGGEIHQWMYDRYSLKNLLIDNGAKDVKVIDAFTSKIPNWSDYNIDGRERIVRKPDSLFMEAIK